MICPVKAIEIRDGMVFLNEGLCIGCKMCAIVCPFGAIQMSGTMPPSIEPPASDISPYLRWFPGLKTIAVKCDLCQFSESGPECVRICPTKALKLVEGDEIERLSKLKRSISAAGAISIFREAEE
jgi:Fe-S-cluster-containing hydrogenase component 2